MPRRRKTIDKPNHAGTFPCLSDSVSATLHYNVVSDFAEPSESGVSELRLFTTNETTLEADNRDVFAGLSGDGGTHTAIGSVLFEDGVTGPQSLTFSPGGLSALQDAINGSDVTVGIAFREFSVTSGIIADFLDEFVLGIPPGNLTIDVVAVPEPTTLTLAALGLIGCAVRRRRGRR